MIGAVITSHAHIWGLHGNTWGLGMYNLIPCILQNVDRSVPVCLLLKLCLSCASTGNRLSTALVDADQQALHTTLRASGTNSVVVEHSGELRHRARLKMLKFP